MSKETDNPLADKIKAINRERQANRVIIPAVRVVVISVILLIIVLVSLAVMWKTY
jgi:hypothetical protein